MTTFQTSVRIERPVEKVFSYLSQPLNLAHWNSAVQAVRRTSAPASGVGSHFTMERRLPSGRARNEIEILACQAPTEFAIRTTSGPTPFVYRYQLAVEDGDTVVHLDAAFESPGAAAVLGPLATRFVKRGVDDNLAALKRILEDEA